MPFKTSSLSFNDLNGIRTRVTAVKGQCLKPLDYEAKVGESGLEPPESEDARFTVWCACQLRFTLLEYLTTAEGFEPPCPKTTGFQDQRNYQLCHTA